MYNFGLCSKDFRNLILTEQGALITAIGSILGLVSIALNISNLTRAKKLSTESIINLARANYMYLQNLQDYKTDMKKDISEGLGALRYNPMLPTNYWNIDLGTFQQQIEQVQFAEELRRTMIMQHDHVA